MTKPKMRAATIAVIDITNIQNSISIPIAFLPRMDKSNPCGR
jgi:hypothetical protein